MLVWSMQGIVAGLFPQLIGFDLEDARSECLPKCEEEEYLDTNAEDSDRPETPPPRRSRGDPGSDERTDCPVITT